MADENEPNEQQTEGTPDEMTVSDPEAPVTPAAPAAESAEVPSGEASCEGTDAPPGDEAPTDGEDEREPGEIAPTEIPAADPAPVEESGERESADAAVAEAAPADDDVLGAPGEVAEEPVADEPAADAAVADERPAESTPTDEPAAADDALAPAAAESGAEPAPRASRPTKKRLPRQLRRRRSKPKREQSGERKPIVRLPKPEHARGRRQERRGVVVSSAMDKTIVVKVDTIKAHPRYKKVVRRSTKFHAHDEQNAAHVGDVVRIVETRPLSKTKNWRLAEIVEAAR